MDADRHGFQDDFPVRTAKHKTVNLEGRHHNSLNTPYFHQPRLRKTRPRYGRMKPQSWRRKSIIRPDFADGGGKRKFFLRCGDTPFSGKFPRAKLQSPRPQEISLALGRPSGIFIGVTSA